MMKVQFIKRERMLLQHIGSDTKLNKNPAYVLNGDTPSHRHTFSGAQKTRSATLQITNLLLPLTGESVAQEGYNKYIMMSRATQSSELNSGQC